jgi:hypothetical protein
MHRLLFILKTAVLALTIGPSHANPSPADQAAVAACAGVTNVVKCLNNGSRFVICNGANSISQPVSAGLVCKDGKIVAASFKDNSLVGVFGSVARAPKSSAPTPTTIPNSLSGIPPAPAPPVISHSFSTIASAPFPNLISAPYPPAVSHSDPMVSHQFPETVSVPYSTMTPVPTISSAPPVSKAPIPTSSWDISMDYPSTTVNPRPLGGLY